MDFTEEYRMLHGRGHSGVTPCSVIEGVIRSNDDQGILVLLDHVPGFTHEARREDHSPAEVAGVVTHRQSIGETGIETSAEFALVVTLVG